MYFISKDNKKEGPYTLDEVLAMRLTDDILAWKDGISWSKVSELPELEHAVIKTPPPLPYEIQNEKKARINEVKKKVAWNIIGYSLLTGAIFAALVSYFINETSYTAYWPDKYYIFHSQDEMNNHLLSYWPIFLGWLLILEIIALIVAGIKIAIAASAFTFKAWFIDVKNIYTIERKYISDKGTIIVLQKSPNRITADDKVLDDLRSFAADGRYTFQDTFIIVKNGAVYSVA